MKSYSSLASIFISALIALFSPAAQSAPPTKDSGKKPGGKPPSTSDLTASEFRIPQSVFVLPADKKAGRDPFFPNSTRPYGSKPKEGPGKPEVIEVTLTLTGIIPFKLAMVNGRTFSEGEEGEVVVNGVRKKIRCLKIQGESVTVELLPEGRSQDLKMRFGSQ